MVFSSSVFLFAFFPVTILGYWLLRKHIELQNLWLLFMSILFYAWGEPSFIFVLLLSSVVNWLIGERIKNNKEINHKKLLLFSSIVLNLGIFIVFKYLGFIVSNINILAGTSIPNPGIRLPIGISFFSFQVMSYQIDVYRGENEEKTSLRDFMLYALMFPQLVAGPIVRFKNVALNLKDRDNSFLKYPDGLSRFVIGLSKKVLIADQVAIVADNAYYFLDYGEVSAATAWIGAIAYSLQIYYDFSGYSDMAIGLGGMLGFKFPENFNYPYISSSIKEFWRRWHMSLYGWFRDYVYIPLGGSRKGKKRTLINTFIIWALTGLWHGAGWNFVVWGLSYCALLIIENGIAKRVHIPSVLGHLYTLVITCSLWVIFRSSTLESGLYYLKSMYGIGRLYDSNSLLLISEAGFVPVLGLLFCYPWREKCGNAIKIIRPLDRELEITHAIVILALFVLCMSMCVTESYSPFIYFNF